MTQDERWMEMYIEMKEDREALYDYIIPHYLMYSTLGRADLIRFQSFQDTMTPNEMKD